MKKPYWIILGPETSWNTAFSHQGIWGVKETLYTEWKALDSGNIIFFYVTKTIKGVVGIGRVATKFIQDKPLWPDEIALGKVIYPYRFEFHVDYLIERNEWKTKQVPVRLSPREGRAGIGLLKEETTGILVKAFREKFNYAVFPSEREKTVEINQVITTAEKPCLNHANIQELIFEIGRLDSFISEKEYHMENERLDVVWRRIEKSVPTYVFEIQVGGDIYHALGKLKHAFDLWNSKIFLVAQNEDFAKADLLLAGTFHEINDKIKKISIAKIHELYRQKRRWIDLENEIGLL